MHKHISDTFSTVSASSENFRKELDGKKVLLFTLSNVLGMKVQLTNYGARIVSCLVPDADGTFDDIVLGYNTIDGYLNSNEAFFGATIGRFSNRIANGKFILDEKEHILEKNDNSNHLHGGNRGLHDVVWEAYKTGLNQVVFRHISEDGEGGYPGKVIIEVSYSLNDLGELTIFYQAVSDKKTILNLTNHAYFNLAGSGSGSVAGHLIWINANEFTPVDKKMIPTGDIQSVDGTVFDFRNEKTMGQDWESNDPQIKYANGFDHNFVLSRTPKRTPEIAARVTEPTTGRILELETTEPGLHFYTANALDGSDIGRDGVPYEARAAFCLETQHFPDSPNKPDFPSVVLEPGKQYKSTTIYRFVT